MESSSSPAALPAALARALRAGSWPGSALQSRYELKSVLASSGSCLVYLAWDHQTSQSVVVKEFRPDALIRADAQGQLKPLSSATATAFERGLRAFIKEAQVLQQCDHPSLVRVLDVVAANGTAYQVMPRYRGRLLLDVRRKMPGPLAGAALRDLLLALLGAVEAFHQRGGVHGGIHPGQILLLDDDRPLLLGPGAAGRAAPAAALHPLAQPAPDGYTAPEQVRPRAQAPLGPWTDCFAVAAVGRFALAGPLELPAALAANESIAALARRLAAGRPDLQYTDALLSALDAALSTEIARRPQTAAQFCERLRGAAAAQPTAAPTLPQPSAPAAQPPHPAGAGRANPADRMGFVPAPGAHAGGPHSAWWMRLSLGTVALAAIGFGAWRVQNLPLDADDLLSKHPPAAGVAATTGWVPAATEAMPTASQVAPSPGQGPAPAAASQARVGADPPASSPGQECGSRTQFALYRCMQAQCERSQWRQHPQCLQWVATERVE